MVQDIYIKRADWHVKIFHNATPLDADEILDALIFAGCSGTRLSEAKAFLWDGEPNKGLTYSGKGITVMVIGHATDGMNYWNTLDHERLHLLQHIAQSRGIDPFGEDIAYISGEFTAAVYKKEKRLLCQGCVSSRMYS